MYKERCLSYDILMSIFESRIYFIGEIPDKAMRCASMGLLVLSAPITLGPQRPFFCVIYLITILPLTGFNYIKEKASILLAK